MGPLYHLPNEEDRKQCLLEAKRVLKPGGLLFAVGISRYVSLLDFLRIGGFNDSDIDNMTNHDLSTGCHVNPKKDPMLFTTAYFHRPEDLHREVDQCGFVDVNVMAIEGPILITKDLANHWADEESKQRLMQFANTVEREPAIMGMSNHIAAVAYKPYNQT